MSAYGSSAHWVVKEGYLKKSPPPDKSLAVSICMHGYLVAIVCIYCLFLGPGSRVYRWQTAVGLAPSFDVFAWWT